MCERKDIDVIDIASPGGTHHDIAVAAAKAGKARVLRKTAGVQFEGMLAKCSMLPARRRRAHGEFQLSRGAGAGSCAAR